MNTLLHNPGLLALTVEDEQKEISVVRPRKIKFAFFQEDSHGGRIPYWHVLDPLSRSFHSTLSIQGLREWRVI